MFKLFLSKKETNLNALLAFESYQVEGKNVNF